MVFVDPAEACLNLKELSISGQNFAHSFWRECENLLFSVDGIWR
jgi:hypothetical protein